MQMISIAAITRLPYHKEISLEGHIFDNSDITRILKHLTVNNFIELVYYLVMLLSLI